MSRFIALTVLILATAVSIGCGFIGEEVVLAGSGNVVAQEEPITDFGKVAVSHAFHVNISQGPGFSVVIRADDNLFEYIQVTKLGDTLKIGLKPGRRCCNGSVTLEADVSMPELTGLDLSGASYANITGFESDKSLDVDVSGASHLRGDIEAGDATFDLSGASQATLSGSAHNVSVEASGASHANLSDFPMDDADINVSGASSAVVNVSGVLNADASGASHVFYTGEPTMGDVDTSGASTVERR
jgi:ribosomal protein L31